MKKKTMLGTVVATVAALLVGATPANAQDATTLVEPTVELATPLLCVGGTVYDAEDVTTLCDTVTTLSNTVIVSPNCPQLVSGHVVLATDLVCTDTSGLIVASDNTVIDLNGHRITCAGSGYAGSCQGFSAAPEPDVGVDTNGFDNVHVFSNEPARDKTTPPAGTINGFDTGVEVQDESDNVKVKQLTITGPASPAARPQSRGILVEGAECGGNIRIGGGTATGNDISHQVTGILLSRSECVYVGYNTVHDNESIPNVCFGIRLFGSSDNLIRSNVLFENGEGLGGDTALQLDGPSVGNLLTENQVNDNQADGISTRFGAVGNDIVNNQMLFDTGFDASDFSGGVNFWNENNRCIDQGGTVPPGVCGPDDVPPPQ